MCILCDNWAATDYARRPTTDISNATGHELMILGYYLGAMSVNQDPLPELCEPHENFLQQIADLKEREAEALALRKTLEQQPQQVQQLNIQQAFKDRLNKLAAPPKPQGPPVPPVFTAIRVETADLTEIPPAGLEAEFRFPCPNCKKMVSNGEIHDCKYIP
jgi:hypothetical protein